MVIFDPQKVTMVIFNPQEVTKSVFKFKIVKRVLQNEYATHIIESATFRLKTEWTIELPNQIGGKKFIAHPTVQLLAFWSFFFCTGFMEGVTFNWDDIMTTRTYAACQRPNLSGPASCIKKTQVTCDYQRENLFKAET